MAARIAARDERAFERLLARYEEPIRRHLAHIARTDANHPREAAAQDLVQEVFLRVWMRVRQWDGRGAFKAWLYRIATNLALNHLRLMRRRREQPLVIDDAWDEQDAEGRIPAWMIDDAALGTSIVPDPHDALEQAECLYEFRQLVDELPDGKRADAYRARGRRHLPALIGPLGPVGGAEGSMVVVRHSRVEGLAPEGLYATAAGARVGLARYWQHGAGMAEEARPRQQPERFTVLARARRADRPGIVSARAATNGEIDPLSDAESRLLVGLPPR